MGVFTCGLLLGKREGGRGKGIGRAGNQESEAGWENLQIAKEVLRFNWKL